MAEELDNKTCEKDLYIIGLLFISSPVMSHALWPHGLQRSRPPCPSFSPEVSPSSYLLHQRHQSSHPLAPSSASIFPSVRDFSSESSVHIRWPKYWSFNFSISPSNKYSGLISLKIDWFDLRAVHGTQDSSLASQFEGINSLVLCHLYGPALTTIRDYWEDHNLDYMDLCQQSNISAFQHTV